MEPNQAPQGEIRTKGPDKKTIIVVIVVLIILTLAYLIAVKYDTKKELNTDKDNETVPMKVVVEPTQAVNGVLPAPEGFPQDIPINKTNIIESNTTEYPDQGAKQLSLSYQSSKTVAHEYGEYKDYMTRAGYTITEGKANSPIRNIFGTRRNANLSVVISSAEGKTLVQIAYLIK